jgi:hypothetical protein
MPRYNDVTAQTYQRFVVDSGIVRKNFTDFDNLGTRIGVTRNGATFTVKTEIRKMPVDGAKGDVKGDKRIVGVSAEMEVEFLELSPEIICLATPGSTTEEVPAGTPTHMEIKRALQIALTDYIDNLVLVGQVSGSDHPIVLKIDNALGDGNLQLGMKDGDESTVKIKFVGHFDPADLDTEPWLVDFPTDVSTTEGV